MAISGHCREASLRNHIDRPSSEQLRVFPDILSDALSGRPHQSQQPSFTAISYRAIFMFLWIRLSFIHKTHALRSLFSSRQVENSWVFISFNSAGFRWTFHFQILYLRQNLQATLNFDGLKFLTALVLFNQSDYLNHPTKDSDWLIVACLNIRI